MSTKIILAPGSSLSDFVRHISHDLSRRRIEYAIVAFFDENSQPIGMIETKGRTSWVEISIKDIVETAINLKAHGVCLLHNHPRSIKEAPDLIASDADISVVNEFTTLLDAAGIVYLGSWIVSNGKVTEVLYDLYSGKVLDSNLLFSEKEIAAIFTRDLINAIEDLTKTDLLQMEQYQISQKYLSGNRINFMVRRFKYWGREGEKWLFVIEVEDGNFGATSIVSLSIEQALNAYDVVNKLLDASENLIQKNVEYTELTAQISNEISCGFYQQDKTQGGFMDVGGSKFFSEVAELSCISQFVADGLEKIDSIRSEENQT
jgi:hypothetical protein